MYFKTCACIYCSYVREGMDRMLCVKTGRVGCGGRRVEMRRGLGKEGGLAVPGADGEVETSVSSG